MKLKATIYKLSGKYYDEVEFDITDDDVEDMKRKYGYGFDGVTDYIEEHSQYTNKNYHFHVTLVDQPVTSPVFCEYLAIAGTPRATSYVKLESGLGI